MFHKVFVLIRELRRRASRSEWAIRLLRLSTCEADFHAPGLFMIQIDGLSQEEFAAAIEKGQMPFLDRLMKKEHYKTHLLYSGLPASTPAFQGELFYGVKTCVPEFSFMDKDSGRVFKMNDPEGAARVERRLRKQGRGLLEGGSSYSNVFTGGASESHVCAADPGWDGLFRAIHPLVFPALFLIYLDIFVRTAALVLMEFFLAAVDCVRGTVSGKHFVQELKFIPLRVLICIFLREFIVAGASIDLARGLPVIHVNFLGYDEQAHRRGPSSLFAHWSLRGIDDAIERLWSSAHRSARRHYDVWIYSDHGQEKAISYERQEGISVQHAVDHVFKRKEILFRSFARGSVLESRRSGFFRLFSEKTKKAPSKQDREDLAATTVAMGPVGVVYLPQRLGPAEKERFAMGCVRAAALPYVLARRGPGQADVWSKEGKFVLPDQAHEIFGGDYPFFREAAEDLVRLCQHPDAGDFVFLGWRRQGAVLSFMVENGTHAGPGIHETQAFALLPQDAPVRHHHKRYLRPMDLREGAQRFLKKSEALPFRPIRRPAGDRLRIMTYNVHSAIGMDGRISPDRIARVIDRQQPDIVALQELDVHMDRTQGVDQAAYIARKLEMRHHFHPSYMKDDGQYGNAVLSRYPMKLVAIKGFPWHGPRGGELRGALWVRIDVPGTPLHLVNTHLSIWPKERFAQADLLCADWLQEMGPAEPLVLCGDFNALPGSAVYRRFARLLDDAQKKMGTKRPSQTWFGEYPFVRIDHVFVNDRVGVTNVHVPRTRLERLASDHLPLVVELNAAQEPARQRPRPLAAHVREA